jgi:hypothetical protein
MIKYIDRIVELVRELLAKPENKVSNRWIREHTYMDGKH